MIFFIGQSYFTLLPIWSRLGGQGHRTEKLYCQQKREFDYHFKQLCVKILMVHFVLYRMVMSLKNLIYWLHRLGYMLYVVTTTRKLSNLTSIIKDQMECFCQLLNNACTMEQPWELSSAAHGSRLITYMSACVITTHSGHTQTKCVLFHRYLTV